MEKWKFDLTEDDYVKFNLYHADNSPKFKRNIFIQRFIVSLIFLVVPLVMHFAFDRPLVTNLIMFGIIWLVWILFFSIGVKRALKKKVIQHVRDADEKGEAVTGQYTLREVKNGLMLGNKRGEIKIKWKSVQSLGEDSDRFYIYIGPEMAYIIPKSAFKGESGVDEFREKVKGKTLKSDDDGDDKNSESKVENPGGQVDVTDDSKQDDAEGKN